MGRESFWTCFGGGERERRKKKKNPPKKLKKKKNRRKKGVPGGDIGRERQDLVDPGGHGGGFWVEFFSWGGEGVSFFWGGGEFFLPERVTVGDR